MNLCHVDAVICKYGERTVQTADNVRQCQHKTDARIRFLCGQETRDRNKSRLIKICIIDVIFQNFQTIQPCCGFGANCSASQITALCDGVRGNRRVAFFYRRQIVLLDVLLTLAQRLRVRVYLFDRVKRCAFAGGNAVTDALDVRMRDIQTILLQQVIDFIDGSGS